MIIFYHNACPDGWTAAWVAKRKYPEATLYPLDHGLTDDQINRLVEFVRNENAIMIDYSLRSREDNDRLAASAKTFRILDHHKTAQAALDGAPYATFDMNRSGAGLAWDYLFGKNSGSWCGPKGDDGLNEYGYFNRPWFIDYVEARDLWRWDSLPKSREVCAYLGTLPYEIAEWDKLLDINAEKALQLGKGALANIQHYVRETIKNTRFGVLFGHEVAMLNTTYLNCSEIGNELAQSAEFGLTWFERKDDVYQFSLRSIGNFDVSAIAKKFNGGGHKNAAGFQLDYKQGRVLIDHVLGRGYQYDQFPDHD